MAVMKEVSFLEGYRIQIILDGDSEIVLNFSDKLKTARFQHLIMDGRFFKGYLTGQHVIKWDDMTELSMEEILYELHRSKQ